MNFVMQFESLGILVLFLVLLLLLLYYTVFSPRRVLKRMNKLSALRMEVTCLKCGYREVRGVEKGVYVGMVIGKCSRCGGDLVVHSIYAEKISPSERRYIT